jgi:hypothetical protein
MKMWKLEERIMFDGAAAEDVAELLNLKLNNFLPLC